MCLSTLILFKRTKHQQDAWHAVRWTLEHLYKDGDVLHLLHVIPRNSSQTPLPAAFLAGASESMDFEEMLVSLIKCHMLSLTPHLFFLALATHSALMERAACSILFMSSDYGMVFLACCSTLLLLVL